MQFTTLALFGLAGFAAAATNGTAAPVAYVTDVVTAYTTYCPFATQVTHNGVTYTATASQTLTITDCPCTITKAVTQQTGSMTPSAAVAQSTAAANGSAPYKPEAFTGAGNKVAAGGSLLAVGAAAVFFL